MVQIIEEKFRLMDRIITAAQVAVDREIPVRVAVVAIKELGSAVAEYERWMEAQETKPAQA